MSETVSVTTKRSIFASSVFLLLVLALGVFMTAVDSYIFSPALPTIANDLHAPLDLVSWTITVGMLFFTVVMPISGKLSDIYGRKKIYIAGIAIFTLGSLLCSFSWDVYSLIAFRGFQAIGAGIVFPAAMAAIDSGSSQGSKGRNMGVLMATGALAMIVGPNLGGFFIQHFGWRTVFYINIPLGIIAILLGFMLQESYGEKSHRIDIPGSALLIGMLGTLLLGLSRLETTSLTDYTVFPFFIAAAILAVALVICEKRVREPILDIGLLARGDVLSLNLAQLLLNMSLTCAIIYVPSFAQVILHMNVQDSGSILTPLSITVLIAAILSGIILDRLGAKTMLLIGSVVATLAIFGLAQYVNDSLGLAIVLALFGLGLGMGMGAFQLIMLSFMPEGEKGTGSGILNTFKNTGSILGAVIGGFFLADATNGSILIGQAFSHIFWSGTLIAVLAVLMVALLILLGFFASRHRTTSMAQDK